MSVDRYTFDTNVFFYSLDDTSREKHTIALRLVGAADPTHCIVMSQTLGELCNSVTRKRRDLLPTAQRTVSATGRLYQVVPALPQDFQDALEAHLQHGLQFWDATLWATARRAGCQVLLSEDLQDGRTLGGVLFRNPFNLTEDEITSLLI